MDHLRANPCAMMYLVLIVVIGILTHFTGALSSEELQDVEWKNTGDAAVEQYPWKLNYRTEILRDMENLSRAEEDILTKIASLSSERDQIRAQKRGHVQCFLNVVSCYRKRR